MTIIHKRLLSHLSTNLYFLINPTPPPHAATQPSFFRILLRLPPFTRQPVKTLRILTPFASLNSIFRGLSKSLPTCNGSAAPRTPSNRECPTQPPSSTPQTSFNHPQTPTVILKPTRTTQKQACVTKATSLRGAVQQRGNLMLHTPIATSITLSSFFCGVLYSLVSRIGCARCLFFLAQCYITGANLHTAHKQERQRPPHPHCRGVPNATVKPTATNSPFFLYTFKQNTLVPIYQKSTAAIII